MKSRIVFDCSVMVIVLGVLGACVSAPEFEKLNIQPPQHNSRSILNLRNTSNLSASLLRQSERIMKSGFLDTSTEEYGYFSINIRQGYFSSNAPLPMVILSSMTITLGYPVWLILGIPNDRGECEIGVTLNIYDSNRTLIKSYAESARIVKYAGLYYSGNMTPKASKQYTKLFESVFASAQMQSAEINNTLLAGGPITAEKEKAVQARRTEEAKAATRAAAAPAPTTNNYTYNYSQPSAPDPAPAVSPAKKQTVKTYTVRVYYFENGQKKFTPTMQTGYSESEAESKAEREWKRMYGTNQNMVFFEAIAQ